MTTDSALLTAMQQLELRLLHTDFRTNTAALEQLLAQDFVEVAPNGRVTSREDVIRWLLQKDPADRWELSDWHVSELAADVRLVRYHAVRSIPASTSKGASHVSLWRFDSASQCWLLHFHQSTKWTT
jgi:hypothetical protein